MAFLVATTSLPAVYRPNDDRWNAARSCQNDRTAFAPKNAKMNRSKNSSLKEQDYVTMDRPKSQKALKKDTVVKAPEHCVKGSPEKKVLTVSATYGNPIEDKAKDQPEMNKTVEQECKTKNEVA